MGQVLRIEVLHILLDIYQKEHFRFVLVVFCSIRHIRIEKS